MLDVKAKIGFAGAESNISTVMFDSYTVGMASAWAGSYHILSMRRHYDEYVVTPRTHYFRSIPGFPTSHPYMRLTAKIRAAGVTGNIGEAVAAIFAHRSLGLMISDIAHIKPNQPFRKRKSPDYLMRMHGHLPGPFKNIWPRGTSSGPLWWPVESKARKDSKSTIKGIHEAFKQLAAYWHAINNSNSTDVGYGMVVSFTYHQSPEVLITLFIPRNRNSLSSHLRSTSYRDYVDQIENDRITKGFLHGC